MGLTVYLVVVRLASPADDRAVLESAHVRRLLSVHATAADRLEHVRVRAGPGRIDLVLAMIAENEPEALLRARAICERAIDSAFPDWRIAAD